MQLWDGKIQTFESLTLMANGVKRLESSNSSVSRSGYHKKGKSKIKFLTDKYCN